MQVFAKFYVLVLLASLGLIKEQQVYAATGCLERIFGYEAPTWPSRYKVAKSFVAHAFGISPQNVEAITEASGFWNSVVVVRIPNLYRGPLKNIEAKPEFVKLKTLTEGPFKGLVGIKKQSWDAQLVEISKLVAQGYKLQKVDSQTYLLKSPRDNYITSDIDLQAVFRYTTSEQLQRIDTNSANFWEALRSHLPKELSDIIKHGANDDFRDANGRPKRRPAADEQFLLITPSGNFYMLNNTATLKMYYQKMNVTWPY